MSAPEAGNQPPTDVTADDSGGHGADHAARRKAAAHPAARVSNRGAGEHGRRCWRLSPSWRRQRNAARRRTLPNRGRLRLCCGCRSIGAVLRLRGGCNLVERRVVVANVAGSSPGHSPQSPGVGLSIAGTCGGRGYCSASRVVLAGLATSGSLSFNEASLLGREVKIARTIGPRWGGQMTAMSLRVP